MIGVDEASNSDAFTHSWSNLPLANFFNDSIDQFVMNILVNDESRTSPTHLSCIHEDPKADGFGTILEICIWEDDVGSFSTEFKCDWCELFTGFCHDGLSCWYPTSKNDSTNVWMACECISNQST